MEKQMQQTIIFKVDEEEKNAIRKTIKILDEICSNSSCPSCPFKLNGECYKSYIDDDLRSIARNEFSITKKADN